MSKVKLTEAEYCATVCGGKCCKIPKDNSQCPNLGTDNLCKIYNERFAPDMPTTMIVGFIEIGNKYKAVNCSRIAELIKFRKLDKEIEDGCCIAHPKLLEIDNGL